ncbi:MAG: cytochrome P450 [Deltaproteobacteria bacterium]|nr:cytochrome P450 [Deltaproteobacteria bacterium]
MDQLKQTGHTPRRAPWYLLLARLLRRLPNPLGFFLDCATRYGDVVNLTLGPRTYLLNNPEDIRYVLEVNHLNYSKTRRLTSRHGKMLSGHGLLTSSGAAALRQRRILHPLFARSTLAGFGEEMVRCTEHLLTRWRPGVEFELTSELLALAQRIMGMTLFSADLLGEAKELAEALMIRRRYIQHYFGFPFPRPFPGHLPTRTDREYRQAMHCIDRTLHDMIHARRTATNPPHDLLSLLVHTRDQDGAALDDRQVRDEALTIATTGYETIGLALVWTWYLLSQNPSVERKLATELDIVLSGRAPDVGDVAKLRYTEMVLSEGMRLYPPTWIFVRVAYQEDTLPTGVHLPAGAKLYLCPYSTQRHPRYFPEPERFEPERFTESAKQARPRFAYFPFAGGPRVCLGQGFALLEGTLVLACMAQRVSLELLPGQSVVPVPGLTLAPKNGIYVRVHTPVSER